MSMEANKIKRPPITSSKHYGVPWWDVARYKVHTSADFQRQFQAAFHSEYYEDELGPEFKERMSTSESSYICTNLCADARNHRLKRRILSS